MLDALSETSDTFPYLQFLDKYISPRATKSNLMPADDSSAQEGTDEDNEEDAVSDDRATARVKIQKVKVPQNKIA